MDKRRIFALFLIWWLTGSQVAAQELQIRGVLANPSADESTEWIAIENTTSATVSASLYRLRDTLGKVVEFSLPGTFEPFELRIFPRTVSGITLNNDREGVELLKNTVVQDSAPLLTSPGNDEVWARLGTSWVFLSLEQWMDRAQSKNWLSIPSASPSPVPSSPPSSVGQVGKLELKFLSPCTSPEWIELVALEAGLVPVLRVEDSSGIIALREELELSVGESYRLEWAGAKLSNSGEWLRVIAPTQEYLFTYEACQGTLPFHFSAGKWVQGELGTVVEVDTPDTLASESATFIEEETQTFTAPEVFYQEEYRLLASVSSKLREPKNFPLAPVPDFAAEELVFLSWKKHALLGSLSLVFAGSTFLILAAPHLWSWYNVHKDPW